MKTLKLVGLSVAAMAALSGCAGHGPKDCKTVYDFRPPATYEGKMCVMRCGHERTQCRSNKEQQYTNCEHHNRMVALEFERCLASGATNCYSASAPPCERPCLGGTCGVDQCEMEYRFCYQSCGGKVVSREICSGCDGWDCD